MINTYGCFNPNFPINNIFATISSSEEDSERIHILVQDFDTFFHAPPDADIPAISLNNNKNIWVKKEWLKEISFENDEL